MTIECQVVRSTDRHAAFVKDTPARPHDIAATLYELLGIPPDPWESSRKSVEL